MKKTVIPLVVIMLLSASCQKQKEHTAPAINPQDSVAVMTSYGVNTLISDSGVIKYRIVTERWEVNQIRQPSRWIFDKGLFLEQFDQKFHVQSYIQADTAYYYDQQRLWELRGRVRILTKDGLRFSSEQLYWDEMKHELYSHVFSHLITPERQLQGSYFRSDEKMTKYYVSNSKGSFERGDMQSDNDTLLSAPDSTKLKLRPQASPQPRNTSIPIMH
ncbi:LPS export ABC transporter periplasmic protein LptC [Prevotella sp. KH2C16]|uniref:LPS export ABC transporter periplasmic protein LptC n=1 Tax=Prevotella sp. KH2C16 TaxID=1855325 RepID=UPI000B82046F|nr:LPS export ABC transporter periplasmic protein LptC [Prevotella sp. KH2C16]